jgi:inorganic pyrophosphatase
VRWGWIVIALIGGACASPDPVGLVERDRLLLPPAIAALGPLNDDGTLNVLVEIPAGTNAKWETAKDLRSIAWERRADGSRRVVQYLPYPANYGMVPGTLLAREDGGDGDPLDVVLLGPARERGELVRARLVGVLALLDDGELDDKLLAVSLDGPFAPVRDVLELEQHFPGTTSILASWFGQYKGPDRVVVEGLRDREAALARVEAATVASD